MKKILIVFNHPAPYKVNLFNELSKYDSIDLTAIFERNNETFRNKGFYTSKLYGFNNENINGIKIGTDNFVSHGIVKHLKHNKYDLIIMNGYSKFAEMYTIRYLNRKHIPYYLYINGGLIPQRELKLKYKLKRKYISSAKGYFSPNKESNNYLIHYGANPNTIMNYPYATIYDSDILNKPLSIEEKNNLKHELNIPIDKKIFVSCGQLIKRKNYDTLINIWEDFPKDYYLYIIGDGKEEKNYKKIIKNHNIKNVFLIGFKSKKIIFKYYQIADLFIFPSKEDIYGHVINESLSQGLPVISMPNVNATKALIKNNYNGYILNTLNSVELISSINKLLGKDLFSNCIEVARKNTLEVMAKQHIEMFENLYENDKK